MTANMMNCFRTVMWSWHIPVDISILCPPAIHFEVFIHQKWRDNPFQYWKICHSLLFLFGLLIICFLFSLFIVDFCSAQMHRCRMWNFISSHDHKSHLSILFLFISLTVTKVLFQSKINISEFKSNFLASHFFTSHFDFLICYFPIQSPKTNAFHTQVWKYSKHQKT